MDKVLDKTKYSNKLDSDITKTRLEFNKALKDPNFKKLVSATNLEQDYLVKYTTKFQDSVEQLKKCQDCKGLACCTNKITGYVYYPVVHNERLEFSYIMCKYMKKKNKEDEYLNNVFVFDEPLTIKNAKMSDIDIDDKSRAKAIKWIGTFAKNYPSNKDKGLYLHGSFGGGKTFLIAALFNELASRGVKVALVYYPEFLRKLKSSFDDDFNKKFEMVKKIDLLLLDDIGAETTTLWSRDEILGPILQYRMQEKLPTFFTSNFNQEELEIHFSLAKDSTDKLKARRIMERIKNMTEDIEMISINRRN